MKHEPVKDHAERKRISALIERCGKEQTMSEYIDVDALTEFVERRFDITWEHDYEGGIKDACVDILDFIDSAPTIKTKQIKYYDDDENVWKIGSVIVDGEREGE